ncbi:signal recognition particle-docking protein FtsY [Thiomicrorhabdus xiamenensis]|uniref:Signal recognition particle receptor FtsY n=1 Tax=Thiomicrorhabdus xiamenensis TaxID=2739063 RepID=A0A7D4NPZ2_9GAMM|nr:signal recognition particle-docking protein FtsY [Thiomicrorhabdus xiamenensis]QKI88352.1 signal recognition particle-docking protein FtsY [Thiomicrorhabdus xiamenensis]
MFSFFRKKKQTHETEENNDSNALNEIPAEEAQPAPEQAREEVQEEAPAASDAIREEAAEVVQKTESPSAETVLAAETKPDESPAETTIPENTPETEPKQPTQAATAAAEEPQKKKGLFARLKDGLSKTRKSFTDSLSSLILGKKEIDADLLDDLEMILLTADVGIDATDRIIQNLTDQVSRKELKDPQALIDALKTQLQEIIDPMSRPLEIDDFLKANDGPYIILMVGINGVGKTTTIGKLAKKFQMEGKSVMLAAGDTFRAAAVEQLQTWGERNNVPVIAQKTGADSAAVIFDAVQSAKAKNIDVLIADTAGRLHTQSNLMEELKKVKRVIGKVDATAPHEVMLVIDAGTGQNALNQTKQFHEAVQVSGITLTKLDGTAKGGIVYALAEQSHIPIRFIGVGEKIDDLRPFDSKDFTEALFDQK